MCNVVVATAAVFRDLISLRSWLPPEVHPPKNRVAIQLSFDFCDHVANQVIVAIISSIMERSWTVREEANALTCCAFRNGYIEELHAGKHSELLEDPELSRITDDEMKKLMIGASAKLAELLAMKESKPDEYWKLVKFFNERYCSRWEK